jgi:hypothetical protein
MHISSQHPHIAPVPAGLLIAAIDFLNECHPTPQFIEPAVIALARRLDYDHTIAAALAIRVRATARMLVDHRWPSIRQLGLAGDTAERRWFDAIVQQFIASASLNEALTFDVNGLQRMLLAALPPRGNG